MSSLFRSVLVGAAGINPVTLLGAAGLLAAVALIACYFPLGERPGSILLRHCDRNRHYRNPQ